MSEVFILDRVRVRAERLDEYRTGLRDRYLPGARERGLCLVGCWADPAHGSDQGRDLFVLWKLPDLASFWNMRGAAAADPRVAAWWQESDALVIDRERRLLSEAPLGWQPKRGSHRGLCLGATTAAEAALCWRAWVRYEDGWG